MGHRKTFEMSLAQHVALQQLSPRINVSAYLRNAIDQVIADAQAGVVRSWGRFIPLEVD